MEVRWDGKPSGKRNVAYEVDNGSAQIREFLFTFSLCRKQDADDPHDFHVWCYNVLNLDRYHDYRIPGTTHGHIKAGTQQECYAAVAEWFPPSILREYRVGTHRERHELIFNANCEITGESF